MFPFFFITNKKNIVPNWLRFSMIVVTTALDLTLCSIIIRMMKRESYERTLRIISNREKNKIDERRATWERMADVKSDDYLQNEFDEFFSGSNHLERGEYEETFKAVSLWFNEIDHEGLLPDHEPSFLG